MCEARTEILILTNSINKSGYEPQLVLYMYLDAYRCSSQISGSQIYICNIAYPNPINKIARLGSPSSNIRARTILAT